MYVKLNTDFLPDGILHPPSWTLDISNMAVGPRWRTSIFGALISGYQRKDFAEEP